MKSPTEVGQILARQWHHSKTRLERLLNPSGWPLEVKIGKPSAHTFAQNPNAVQRHIEAWRKIDIGTVDWIPTTYRAGLDAVPMPMRWSLRTPSEWIAASIDPIVRREYAQLKYLIERVAPCFYALLIAQRSVWLKKAPDEVIAAADLATRLAPGCAKGRPLRLLAEHGVDTKFFERNATLLTKLLDERFEGEVSQQGLTTFLGALDENNNWVLLVPLSSGLLPFKRLRVTTAELAKVGLSCSHVLAVENEQCLHLLPELQGTIAVLGSGLDLQWLAAPKLSEVSIGYWGDLDTWGLSMLARARQQHPIITPILMNRLLFDTYAQDCAVIEPVKANDSPPEGLNCQEADLYRYLLGLDRGRLEQEYLPREVVQAALVIWVGENG